MTFKEKYAAENSGVSKLYYYNPDKDWISNLAAAFFFMNNAFASCFIENADWGEQFTFSS